MTPFSQSLDCPGAVPETFMVNATNDDGSAGCVHTDMIAEPTSQGRLRINFTENVNILIVNEVYDARIHAVNSVGNTPSSGLVKFSKYYLHNCCMQYGTHYIKDTIYDTRGSTELLFYDHVWYCPY